MSSALTAILVFRHKDATNCTAFLDQTGCVVHAHVALCPAVLGMMKGEWFFDLLTLLTARWAVLGRYHSHVELLFLVLPQAAALCHDYVFQVQARAAVG